MKRKLNLLCGMAVVIAVGAALFKYSLELAATQAYDPVECEAVFAARILATGQTTNSEPIASLYQLPLLWLARGASQSVELFASARIVAFLLFWLNLLLLASATGVPLRSWKWLAAFLGAATLSLMWDFGFEIRSANLLLTGLLLTWTAVRAERAGIGAFVFAGALAVAMQFTVATAWLYVLPLMLGVMLLHPTGEKSARWKLLFAWLAGALGMLVVVRTSLGAMGLWDACWAGLWERAPVSSAPQGKVLGRVLTESPLLVAVSLAGLLSVFLDWRRRGKAALAWEGAFPEAGLSLLGFVVAFLHPSSQPGSLLVLAAFAFLLAFRYASGVAPQLWSANVPEAVAPSGSQSCSARLEEADDNSNVESPPPDVGGYPRQAQGKASLRPVIVALLIFTHFVPFLLAAKFRSSRVNFRQTNLMQLAEEFTDPRTDWVYDDIGLVPTRASTNYRQRLPGGDGQNLESPGSPVGVLLAQRPAAVFIRTHRTDELTEADRAFLDQHYVALGDDFWVLGANLLKGGGEFEILHPGRYRISYRQQSNLLGTYPEGLAELLAAAKTNKVEVPFNGTVDGGAVSNRPVELAVGKHRVESAGDDEIAVVWVGPRLEKPPQIGSGDHRRLFVNWY